MSHIEPPPTDTPNEDAWVSQHVTGACDGIRRYAHPVRSIGATVCACDVLGNDSPGGRP